MKTSLLPRYSILLLAGLFGSMIVAAAAVAQGRSEETGTTSSAPLSGRRLLKLLGQDYADPYVTNKDILHACQRLQQLLDSNADVREVDYLAFTPRGNAGFGEHAAIALRFGADQPREFIVIDIGRRPPDSRSQELSVLRVYELQPFLHYALQVPVNRNPTLEDVSRSSLRKISISTMCPNRAARRLSKNILNDLAPYIAKPEHDPIAWNFNLLFHNCARYTQDRLGSVCEPLELRQFLLSYAFNRPITPTKFADHLEKCDLFAQLIASRNQGNLFAWRAPVARPTKDLTQSEVTKIRRYFAGLPTNEKRQWTVFLQSAPQLRSEASTFTNSLK